MKLWIFVLVLAVGGLLAYFLFYPYLGVSFVWWKDYAIAAYWAVFGLLAGLLSKSG